MEMSDLLKSLSHAPVQPIRQVHGPRNSRVGIVTPQQGKTYRVTAADAPSVIESQAYARKNWYGSPYALQNSERAKRQESAARAAKIGGRR
jgi:hypothetical protein